MWIEVHNILLPFGDSNYKKDRKNVPIIARYIRNYGFMHLDHRDLFGSMSYPLLFASQLQKVCNRKVLFYYTFHIMLYALAAFDLKLIITYSL